MNDRAIADAENHGPHYEPFMHSQSSQGDSPAFRNVNVNHPIPFLCHRSNRESTYVTNLTATSYSRGGSLGGVDFTVMFSCQAEQATCSISVLSGDDDRATTHMVNKRRTMILIVKSPNNLFLYFPYVQSRD
ncbi:hypothetical protein AVEN_253521-1 [Araneus ventricosus]|uniref:Uncharacterized protein n=1 Tax=Araneus ventricosus TaxID=182803 RepID=A0A4Y2BSJ2_ARAVE|nr:hypothetical protein AVEN_253521-1 [Araneus ventricosus]